MSSSLLIRHAHGLRPLQRLAVVVTTFLVFAVGTSGCALTSKADLVGIRYFSPEVARPHLNAAKAEQSSLSPASSGCDVRLGRVTSGAHLRERIAYRDSAYETGYYEDQRWTERPEIYVRRELSRTLFEDRGLHRVFGGASAFTLDVEVIAFDELRLPTGRAARVRLHVVLSDDRGAIFEETITIDRSAAARIPNIEGLVAAMAEALDLAAERVATRVASSVANRCQPATPATATP
jgi:ABC-type uncharacterized transport system auxiliary subunit